MQSSSPVVKDLVLLGAGHSHAIALKYFGMHPLAGVRLTVVTADVHTPYSGMLPGHVAGYYDYDECHIDTRPLAGFAGARLFASRATGLDLDRQLVLCDNRPPVPFDLLSIDIGSTPAVPDVPGAKDFAIPAKPVRQFLQHWQGLLEQVRDRPDAPLTLAVVGGGAGGVELTLAARSRLVDVLRGAGQSADRLELHLFQRGSELMPSHPAWVRRRFERVLRDRGVQVHLNDPVREVGDGWVRARQTVKCDRVFWVTQAIAPDWLRASGLATDDRGFIQVNDALQSISHPQVFAAGDIATMVNHPRPKAGVFAVRQGQPLVENLQRAARNEALQPFQPQQHFLTLIGTGDRSAVAARGRWAWQSPWMWRWKDRIDRQFMARFLDLEPSAMAEAVPQPDRAPSDPLMRCRGCGSKVGSTALMRALDRVKTLLPESKSAIAVGLDAPDDAAVLQVPSDRLLVQTVDYFPAITDDPFVAGRIAIEHCLNDIWAMGARPHSVQALVAIPPATAIKTEEMLYQILAGAVRALQPDAVPIAGGHTLEADEMAIGFVCNGWLERDRLWRKTGLQPGQLLIGTKALGTGVLFAADMQLKAKSRWIEAAIRAMTQSNRAAAECLREYGATACTDISGFGLVGHAAEMARASSIQLDIQLDRLTLLAGAVESSQAGIASSLYPQNWRASRDLVDCDRVTSHPHLPLVFDPQTSGGLLAGVPEERAEACLAELRSLGYTNSHVVGRVLPQQPGRALITMDGRSP
ncbi:MAG: selenide, water dikinase SelD [Cyanobacteria bacterium J06639_1]